MGTTNGPSELIATAYEAVVERYRVSVDVTMFTWRLFYIRNAAMVTAAGVLYYNSPLPVQSRQWVAVLLLLVCALINIVTIVQMLDNQKVIAKAQLAGLWLELKAPELGILFHLDAEPSLLSGSLTSLEKIKQGALPRKNLDEYFRGFGLKPKTWYLGALFSLVCLVLATYAMLELRH